MALAGSQNPNWKGGPILVCCEECGTESYVKRAYGKHRFCSLACANIYQRKHPRSGSRKPKVTKHCRQCGVEYGTRPSSRQVFCSGACHSKWRSNRFSKSGNPNWLGGMPRNNAYPTEFFEIRESILRRDGYRCACPACRTNSTRVHVHHIDYNKANCSPENLITACPSCNARANFNRVLWQGILSTFNRWRFASGALNIGQRGTIEIHNGHNWNHEPVRP